MTRKMSKQPPTMLHLHASPPPGKEKPTSMFTMGMVGLVPMGAKKKMRPGALGEESWSRSIC